MGKLSSAGQHLGGGIPQVSWARSSGYCPSFRAGHGVTSLQSTGPAEHLAARCLTGPLSATAWGSNFCDSQDAEDECGSTGQSRSERGMDLLKRKYCPQAAAGVPDVSNPVQKEERLNSFMAGCFLPHVVSVWKNSIEM